jgi:hypothetical protein
MPRLLARSPPPAVLEVLMIVYVHWKLIPVLQVHQPVFNGGVACGILGRETERERGRVRERERALLIKKNTTMGQSNHCRLVDLQGGEGGQKGGGAQHVFASKRVVIYIHMYVYTYIYTYICMYIRIYTHTHMVAENDLLQGGPDLLDTCRRQQTIMRQLHEFTEDPGHGLVHVFETGSSQWCG